MERTSEIKTSDNVDDVPAQGKRQSELRIENKIDLFLSFRYAPDSFEKLESLTLLRALYKQKAKSNCQ